MKSKGQRQLAEDLGIARSYLCSILNKKAKCSIRLAKEISHRTGIPVLELRPDLKELFKEIL
jgi:transcriptional regulator with XRE-family HTH domain